MRYEAKHKVLKSIVNANKKNIPLTICTRIQLQFCQRILSQTGLSELVEYGQPHLIDSIKEFKLYTHKLPINTNSFFSTSWYKINGIKYAPRKLLLYDLTKSDTPQFCQIVKILIDKENLNNCIFFCKLYNTEYFDLHYRTYILKCLNEHDFIFVKNLPFIKPCLELKIKNGLDCTSFNY